MCFVVSIHRTVVCCLSVGFFGRPERTYLATFQFFGWLLEDQIFLLAFFTEFERHTLRRWVSRNLGLGLFQIVLSNSELILKNGLLLPPVSKSWLIFKSSLFLRQIYVFIFVQKLAYFEKKPLFSPLSIHSCFHLCPKFGLLSNTCYCYLCPKVGLISQGTGLFNFL